MILITIIKEGDKKKQGAMRVDEKGYPQKIMNKSYLVSKY